MDLSEEKEIDVENMDNLRYISNDRQNVEKSDIDMLFSNLIITDDIPILIEEDITSNSIHIFKMALMSTIDKLYDTIDFLKSEIEEKNLHIRTLMLRDVDVLQPEHDFFEIETTPSMQTDNDFINENSSKVTNPQGTFGDDDHSDIVFPEVVRNNPVNFPPDSSTIPKFNEDMSSTSISELMECSHSNSNNSDCLIIDNSYYGDNEESFCMECEALVSSDINEDSANYNLPKLLPQSINDQLKDYRNTSHSNYIDKRHQNKIMDDVISDTNSQFIDRGLNLNLINGTNNKNNINLLNNSNAINIYETDIDVNALWKPGTTLIIGDSMLNGLDEKRLKNCKVRPYPGSSIEDMHFNIIPLLRKKPTNIILHVGTNNCINDNSSQIISKLIRLKEFILSHLDCNLIFSSLIGRWDHAKANLTGEMTNKYLSDLDVEIIDNSNITAKHLGKKGHHLTPYGTARLAMNYIQVLKYL